MAFVTAASNGAKVKKPQDLWSIFLDDKFQDNDTFQALTQEEYEQIKKAHGIN